MLAQSVTRRLPLWAAFLCAWWVQSYAYPRHWPDSLRPEWLLVMVIFVALRTTPTRGALWGLLAGWLIMLVHPGHAWWLLAWWVLFGYGLAWLHTQWYTEGRGFFVMASALSVMLWHGLTWLGAWSGTAAPRRWTLSFIVAQWVVTLVCALAWWHYAPRWIRLEIDRTEGSKQ